MVDVRPASGFELVDEILSVAPRSGRDEVVAKAIRIRAECHETEAVIIREPVQTVAQRLPRLLDLFSRHTAGRVEHEDDVFRLDPLPVRIRLRRQHQHEIARPIAVGPMCQQRGTDLAIIQPEVHDKIAIVFDGRLVLHHRPTATRTLGIYSVRRRINIRDRCGRREFDANARKGLLIVVRLETRPAAARTLAG